MAPPRRLRIVPGRRLIASLAVSAAVLFVALVGGADVRETGWAAAALLALAVVLTSADYTRSRALWRGASPRIHRRLPAAFAIGVRREIHVAIDLEGQANWRCRLYDHADSSLAAEGLPLQLELEARAHVATSYAVVPTRRGTVTFAPFEARLESRWRLCELLEPVGSEESRRVYPDFAQVARYAWLAGDRRLQEIGIKSYQQRGQGTDFKQLSEYRIGDSVRHIDWRATLRLKRPIVRQFQDERDQCVMILVDCGRRMRADDRRQRVGTSHFDQVLNAVMLLSYVALKQGDAVGAMTFGTPAGEERSFPPRKGAHALNALMGELHAVEPTATHSDYVAAAQSVLLAYPKRALVIVVTNFRDEDGTELGSALRLLRSRHLVLLASLRERIVSDLISQRLASGDTALDVASGHLYEQARRDAFNRLAARDSMMVDAEPHDLGVALVNRYHAIKRAGLI